MRNLNFSYEFLLSIKPGAVVSARSILSKVHPECEWFNMLFFNYILQNANFSFYSFHISQRN